jgi:hypothetical protein
VTRHLAAVPPDTTAAARRRLAYAMSEDELQENIRELCDLLGLAVQHIHDSRRCWLSGWPDITIIGPAGLLFRELKSETGKPTPEQTAVGYKIKAAGASWKLWRPSDWLAGRIEAELRGIAGTAEMF